MELPSWLTGATAEQRGRAVKSRGPLTEQNPSCSRYRDRSPRPGGSPCGDPSVSNETSVNSGSASGVPAAPVGEYTLLNKPQNLSAVKKKNLHVIHDESCPC